jgi:rare lipoprotein A
MKRYIIPLICCLICSNVFASETLKASWYSVESLKKEGTWKTSKGVMADGTLFNDNSYVCATRLYPLHTILCITNVQSGRSVIVRVADRIGKRFATKRIDLSKRAFSEIANLEQGVVPIKVEVLNGKVQKR